ncbi:hypothetical protein AB0E81_19235 [Streptomyces sp. NPDC033538]|uniref:hypothetical protein n=1 Tax=Streptomyces sp. NPDC033538 TaxID=3155367 RepID=UPI0033D41F99
MPQPPGPGHTVLYRITEDDAPNTTHRRVRSGITDNHVDAGQRYPAADGRVWPGHSDYACNLRVLLDGQGPPLWAMSRLRGDVPGTWPRPERV